MISGGVASNNFIAKGLKLSCSQLGYRFVRTPAKLCTDNGIMVAWNGVEKFVQNIDVVKDENEREKIDVAHKSPIGEDWSHLVEKENIERCRIKLNFNELITE